MEKPIKFKNRNGQQLFGMMFLPCDNPGMRKIGIIISVNAIKYRIGTFRLHTLLARKLCKMGYYVMYFDPAGIGDSEGSFEEKYLIEHYLDIQMGKYNEDIMDAVSLFQSQFHPDNILLFGLCGGAISMLIVAARDPRINGLILLGIPVFLENVKTKSKEFDEVSVITSKEQATRTLLPLFRKLIDIQTWIKILTFKIYWKKELRIATKALITLAKECINKIFLILNRKKGYITLEDPVSQHPRYNVLFQNSFQRFVASGGKILFLFAELDFITWIFKSEFQDKALVHGNPYEGLYEIYVIKNANHIFSAKDSQIQLITNVEKWLHKNFPINL